MASEDEGHEAGADPGSLSRRSFLALSAAAAASVVLPGMDTAAAAAQGGCKPFLTPPDYLGIVPTTTQVLGFEAGRREMTTAQCYQYLDAVAAASDRVKVGVVGHSAAGREIRYAVIGRPEHVTNAGLEKVRQAHYEIADPSTPKSRVEHLADTTPAFLWVCGNIHGDEESGADAIVSLVYGLADRDDCVVNRILKDAVVVVVPVQNPDGRTLDFRRNYYAFDLNRDHFGRTQPETDGKIQLMRKYPPLVLTDHHEFSFYRAFFPPTDDPVYHEVTNRQIHDIYDDLRSGHGRGVRAARMELLQPGLRLRLLLADLHRYRDLVRVPGSGDDGRGLQRRLDLPAVEPAPRRHVGHARDGRRPQPQAAPGPAHRIGGSRAAGPQGRPVAEPRLRARQPSAGRGAEHAGEALLHPRRPTELARGVAAARPHAAADGRRGAPAHAPLDRARLPAPPGGAAARNAAGRHVLDPDGPTPEALDPGRDERGNLRADQPGLRPHRLQSGAPVRRGHRLVGRGARSSCEGSPRRCRSRPRRSITAACRRSKSCGSPRTRSTPGRERAGSSFSSTTSGEGSRTRSSTRRTSATGRSRGPMSCASRRAEARRCCERLGHKGQRALVDWVNGGGRYIGWRWGGAQIPWALGLSERALRLSEHPASRHAAPCATGPVEPADQEGRQRGVVRLRLRRGDVEEALRQCARGVVPEAAGRGDRGQRLPRRHPAATRQRGRGG